MRSELAPTWGSRNNTVWEKYVDIAFLVANCIILLVTSFVGIAANLFVTWAVYHQKSLRTWNNALLVNLAIVDILRCAIDCPILFTIVMTVHQRGHVDELFCDAQVAFFSFSCCIQLLTLACISAERYQAIAHPFKICQRRRRIIVLIPLSWTMAISVAVICVVFVKDSPVYVTCLGARWETLPSYDTFGLYILVPLWTTCFGVIIGFYARIFALVKAHSRKIFDKGSFPLSKKGATEEAAKDATKDVTCEPKAAETKSGETDQQQTQRETVILVEQVMQVEPNSQSKDDTPGLRSSTKEPQNDFSDSHEESKSTVKRRHKWQMAYVKIVETRAGIEQTHPHVIQVEPNLFSIDATACPRSSTKEPQSILNDSDNMPENTSKATVKKDEQPSGMEQPHLQVMKFELNSSNEDKRSCLKSSTKESQRVLNDSNVINNKSKDTAKMAKTHPGIEQPHPRVMQGEPNSSNNDNMTGRRSSKQRPSICNDSGDKNECKDAGKIVKSPPEVEQQHPRVTQIEPNGLKSSGKERQSVLNDSGAVDKSKGTVKIAETPQMMRVETNSSNKDRTDGLRNPARETQSKSNYADNLKESEATEKIAGLPPGSEHVLPAPQMDNPKAPSVSLTNLEQTKDGGAKEAPSAAEADEVTPLPTKEPQATNPIPATADAQEVDGAVCMMPSLANKETANKKKDSKLAKRSGYIILTFLFFWLPLIANILMNVLVHKTRSSEMATIRDLEVLSVSVACMTSLSNPIIYAAVNPQFRSEFYRLKRKFKALRKKR